MTWIGQSTSMNERLGVEAENRAAASRRCRHMGHSRETPRKMAPVVVLPGPVTTVAARSRVRIRNGAVDRLLTVSVPLGDLQELDAQSIAAAVSSIPGVGV